MSYPYKNPQFTVRIPKELLEKLKFIAQGNARTTNKEIEFLVRKHIQEYEKQHGEISIQMD